MPGEGFKPKLTGAQRAEIFRRTLNGEKCRDLAEEFGVSDQTIRTIKYDPKRLKKAEQAMTSHQLYAKLRIHQGAMKGLEKEHEILEREVPDGEKGVGLLYLQHQVASGLMDRDGMKAAEKTEQRVEITFTDDDIPMGMPGDDDE